MNLPYEFREPLFEVRGVGLTLGGYTILDGVDVTIRNVVRPNVSQGQVVGILGPSGIGKTQLMRVMSGLQTPDRGSVRLVSGSGEWIPVRPGLVGVVAQNYPLFRHRTVLGNLLVAGSSGGLDGRSSSSRASDLLERFGLSDKASSYPSQLSGGQRQRVAIAQQLMCGGHFLIMDEPFTGLDPIMKERTCELIRQVSLMDERNTIFVVAHDVPAVAAISDTLWLMGRDRDPSGVPKPGSRIQRSYDLMEMGLAWTPGIQSDPRFHALASGIREAFFQM